MWNFMREIWNRVIKNWETSAVGIIAGGVVVAGWLGYTISSKEVLAVIVGIQMFALLFAKD